MRVAELVMAIGMGILSLYLMWKSSELPIGWIEGSGPGAGAWPFWLATIMLLSCIWIGINWVRKTSWPSRSTDPYFQISELVMVGSVAIALTVTIALIHFIGIYLAIPLFLLFYIGVLGRHGWLTTIGISLLSPVITFLFFEVALAITLPKGYSEPAFIPIYERVYKCPRKETWGDWAYCYLDPKK